MHQVIVHFEYGGILVRGYAILHDFICYSFLPRISKREIELYLEELNLRIFISSDSLDIVDEVYCLQGYFRYYNGKPNVIVDVGAHCGLFTLVAYKLLKPKIIVALEPSKSNYRLLIKNIRRNSLTNITILNKALWVNKTEVNFVDKGRWSGEASIVYTSETLNNNKIYNVSTVSMYDILNIIRHVTGYDKIDFLKIDIEGAELPVLTINNRWLNKVEYLVLEVHWSKYGFPGVRKIIETLRKFNFSVRCCKVEFDYRTALRCWIKLLKANLYPSVLIYTLGKFFIGPFRQKKRLDLLVAAKWGICG